jgi:Coenzyme PQQ synthesis protein D (PqqD)
VEEHARARHDQLLVEELGDELVVYDLERGEVHLLNPAAAFVWRRCDGRTTVTRLASLLRAELGLPANDELVLLAREELEKNHLLEEKGAPSVTTDSLSRSQMIRRLAVATGIGLMLPVIESLNPPPAHAAASLTPPAGSQCGYKRLGKLVCEGGCPHGQTCEKLKDEEGNYYCGCTAVA